MTVPFSLTICTTLPAGDFNWAIRNVQAECRHHACGQLPARSSTGRAALPIAGGASADRLADCHPFDHPAHSGKVAVADIARPSSPPQTSSMLLPSGVTSRMLLT
jgi:hypothetical protein